MSYVAAEELMAITASRLLADDKVVFAGVGMPLLAAGLARRTHAPRLTIVLEGGIIGTSLLPGKLPISTNEMRAPYGAQRLPDSGGENDIIALCNEVFIVTQHEPRRFVPRVDFITSPGYLSGSDSRVKAGLVGGSLGAVVTDLALLDFEPSSRRMRLRALQAGVTVAQVRAQTGFDLLIGEEVGDGVTELAPPSAEEVAIYRELRDGPERVPAGAV